MAVNICYWQYENRGKLWVKNFWSERASQAYTIVAEPHSHVGNSHLKGAVNVSWDLRKMFSAAWCKKNLESQQRILHYSGSLPLCLGVVASDTLVRVELPFHHSMVFKGFLSVLACLKAQLMNPLPEVLYRSRSYCLRHVDNSNDLGPPLCSVVTCVWYGDNPRQYQ